MYRRWTMGSLRRTELLNSINTNVDSCNRLTDIRLNQCRLLNESSLDDVKEYLTTRRIALFYSSDAIQRTFDKQFIKLL